MKLLAASLNLIRLSLSSRLTASNQQADVGEGAGEPSPVVVACLVCHSVLSTHCASLSVSFSLSLSPHLSPFPPNSLTPFPPFPTHQSPTLLAIKTRGIMAGVGNFVFCLSQFSFSPPPLRGLHRCVVKAVLRFLCYDARNCRREPQEASS